jgi:hypothetical protein
MTFCIEFDAMDMEMTGGGVVKGTTRGMVSE